MDDANTARLTLELDLSPGRIRGSLEDERGEPRRFDGWMQLTSALEAVRSGARERPAETTYLPLITNHGHWRIDELDPTAWPARPVRW